MKKPKLAFPDGPAIRALRRKLGLSQIEFWDRVDVTQSGGSRYESGRAIPKAVAMLLHLTYGSEKQAQTMLDWLRRGSSETSQ